MAERTFRRRGVDTFRELLARLLVTRPGLRKKPSTAGPPSRGPPHD